MTRERDQTMRQTVTVFLCAGALLVASHAHAQDLTVPPDPALTVAPGEPRGLVVEIAEAEAQVAGPPGVLLSLVARTPGVPVRLHAVRGTDTRPVAVLVVENTSGQPLRTLAVSLTWTPLDGPARRRVVVLGVALGAGEIRRVTVSEDEAAQGLAGAQGVIEVAPAGARAVDETTWWYSPGRVWSTGAPTVACADATWAAQPTGTDLPDPTSGAIMRCDVDGRWRQLDAEGAR